MQALAEIWRFLVALCLVVEPLELFCLKVLIPLILPLVYQLLDFLIEPLNALSVLPEPVLDSTIGVHDVRSEAMLLSLVPIACILSAILPLVDAEPLLLVLLIHA